MTSNHEYHICPWYYWFTVFLSLQSITTALNSSSLNPALSSLSVIYSTTILKNNTTPTTHTPYQTIHTTTTHNLILPTPTHTILPTQSSRIVSVGGNSTVPPSPRGQPTMKPLSAFGIVMLSLGGVLVVVLVVCLLFICCHGRERGPGGTHVPHSNVKMKPWRSTELSTANELTENTVDALDSTNHSHSHQNVGLTNSPQTSPNLSAAPVNNNTSISTPTGTFRESKMI